MMGELPSRPIVCGRALTYAPTMKRHSLALALCFVVAFSAQGAFFKWTDADGVVHYSDHREKGAVRVDLPEPTVYAPPPLPSLQGQAKSPPEDSEPPVSYEHFAILAPTQGQYLRNATGEVDVRFDLKPALQAGHRIQLALDGVGAQQSVTSTHALLKNVYRGPHSLFAEVIDQRGATVVSAEPVRFFLFVETVDRPKGETGDEPGTDVTSSPYAPAPHQNDSYTPGSPGSGSSQNAPDYVPAPSPPGGGETFTPVGPGGGSVYAPSYGPSN